MPARAVPSSMMHVHLYDLRAGGGRDGGRVEQAGPHRTQVQVQSAGSEDIACGRGAELEYLQVGNSRLLTPFAR